MRLEGVIARACLAIGLLLVGYDEAASKRLALVIGVNDYAAPDWPDLKKAVGDARAMAAALKSLGFEDVTLVENPDFRKFGAELDAFERKIGAGDEVVFHYSGHGVAIGGRTQLLPTDMPPPLAGDQRNAQRSSFDVEREVVDVIRARRPRYLFAVVDACRDNPFAAVTSRGMTRGASPRDVADSLARMQTEPGVLLLYSALWGQQALDNLGPEDRSPTSVFMRVLLKHIQMENVRLDDVAKLTRGEVETLAKTINHPQRPTMIGDTGDAPVVLRPVSEADVTRVWRLALMDFNRGSDAGLREFMERYKKDPRSDEALDLIETRDDDKAFEEAKKGNTRIALENYKRRPGARRKSEADDLIAAMQPACDGLKVLVGPLNAQNVRCIKPESGQAFKDCAECPEMVVAPAGAFQMGSPDSEPERDSDEGPRHLVTIPRAFAVGKYEVTFDEWDACVKDGGCGGHKPDDDKWGRGRLPVINVSWDQAQSYVAWISKKTGRTYRLLSEPEWEYAARAGTQTPFWWGKTITTKQANYNGNQIYDNGAKEEYREKTMPVNTLEANSWGLFHVHGNVHEWVEDCWMENYSSKSDDLKKTGASFKTENCTLPVVRGGSWNRSPGGLRSAIRSKGEPEDSYGFLGFRLARTL